MSDEKSPPKLWIVVLQFIAVILIIWAVVTLISGLQFAEIFPDDPEMGRAFPFEDTGIANYGVFAAVGGVVGVILLVVTIVLNRKKD